MEVEKAIEELNKLDTLSDKLNYYNDNFSLLIGIGNSDHQVGFGIAREQYNIFCLCDQCKNKYTASDFETYRDIRNQETQKVVDFFESTSDYKTKIEFYFKISEGFSTTIRTLFFVPDKLSEINIHEFPYKIFTIDITPKDNSEITILKNHLKQKLLGQETSVYLPMAQFTFEKRVEAIEKYLKIRTEKNRRDELIQSEYDKINLSKVDSNSKKPYDTMLLKILKVAEDIIQDKHNEFHTEFRKTEITILAEDTIRYEQYLNSLYQQGSIIQNSNILENDQQQQFHLQKINSIIEEYKKAIPSVYFKDCLKLLEEDGTPNDFYYSGIISRWKNQRNDEISKNITLAGRDKLLKTYNNILALLMSDIVMLFKSILKDDKTQKLQSAIMNDINFKGFNISNHLENVGNFGEIIKHNISTNDFYLAIKIQGQCLLMFDDSVKLLDNQLFIKINRSPLKEKFQIARDAIENAFDLEKIKLLIKLSEKEKKSLQNTTLSDFGIINNGIENSSINTEKGNLPIDEFVSFGTPDEIESDKKKNTISDIVNSPTNKQLQIINIDFEDTLAISDEANPYPRIFKNIAAYNIFKNLLEDFGNTDENLANYSFVYHRMKKDELIYDDYQKLQFTYFLLEFAIKIDRIKRMAEIGKIPYRDSIYAKAK